MSIVTTEGIIPERYDHELDNRDSGTTWLRMEGMHGDYIEVDPGLIMGNMIENCFNEDVLFLFNRFCGYLDNLEADNDGYLKDDVKTDHIRGFRDYLTCMIKQSEAIKASGQPINPDTGEQA